MFKKLALIPLLTLAACSGETAQQATPEGLKQAFEGQTPAEVIELANAVAQDFINLVNDDNELLSIIVPWESFKPKRQCFDYWHSKGEFIPTPEIINNCELWAKEISWLYSTYGYEVVPLAFKSDMFWTRIQTYFKSSERIEKFALYKAKQGPNPRCPKRMQKGWQEAEVIPWGSDRPEYCAAGEDW